MSLAPSSQSALVKIIAPSLVIIYILRHFYMKRYSKARVSDGIAERMNRLLSRVRGGSLKRASSGRRVEKKPDPKDGERPVQKDEEEPETDPSHDPPTDKLSSLIKSPDTYGSTESLDGAPEASADSTPKALSRRSSHSQSRKKSPLSQHVNFQSPEAKPAPESEDTVPVPTPTPSRASSRRSPKQRLRGIVPSILSIVSSAASAKSERSEATFHQPRSTATMRRLAAYKAVDDNFPTSQPAYVAIGSGATMVQVVERISQYSFRQLANVTFVSTGVASEHIMASYKLRPITSLNLLSPEQKIDVYFDTADEVDDGLNCIRGRTGNLHLERIIALRSDSFVCIVDCYKRAPMLFTTGKPMTVEVTPDSYFHVLQELRASGATAVLRSGEPAMSGPCFTGRGTYLVDSSWPPLRNSDDEVRRLAEMVKQIHGVVDHGLFYDGETYWNGRPSRVYVGLDDGTVATLEARS
ncbi:Ribose-5-phosphate isomerase [Drechslerella dactyloides]|uniref:Ribose-5-phosphate isomerase n=1 Tax=Drechslerella dactyloides TaxID=74499 RepID=A0AAD6IY41_DREDA|nr:Ribose-5-phosphate isomerase [Drechslerella dactyloides]